MEVALQLHIHTNHPVFYWLIFRINHQADTSVAHLKSALYRHHKKDHFAMLLLSAWLILFRLISFNELQCISIKITTKKSLSA